VADALAWADDERENVRGMYEVLQERFGPDAARAAFEAIEIGTLTHEQAETIWDAEVEAKKRLSGAPSDAEVTKPVAGARGTTAEPIGAGERGTREPEKPSAGSGSSSSDFATQLTETTLASTSLQEGSSTSSNPRARVATRATRLRDSGRTRPDSEGSRPDFASRLSDPTRKFRSVHGNAVYAVHGTTVLAANVSIARDYFTAAGGSGLTNLELAGKINRSKRVAKRVVAVLIAEEFIYTNDPPFGRVRRYYVTKSQP
jgi:hypothetical protein